MSKPQVYCWILLLCILSCLDVSIAGGNHHSKPEINAGMTIQELVNNGLRIAMVVGHSGKKYSPTFEVSAIALHNTDDPVTELENIISTFGNDGFGRASNNLYVCFAEDPYLRLFQLAKSVGTNQYDRTLKLGNVVESKPDYEVPFKIGNFLIQNNLRLSFVSNSALDMDGSYKLAQARRNKEWIMVYAPKYASTVVPTYPMLDGMTLDYGNNYYGNTYEPSAPPAPDSWQDTFASWYAPKADSGSKPKIRYEQTLKRLYDDGLYVSLILAPTDEAAAWMPGEPFTLTAFAGAYDYRTTKNVLDNLDNLNNLVSGVRFITIKGDPYARLFQLKKVGWEWVIDRCQDKSMSGAPFKLKDRLRQGDSQHAYFAYDDIKFVPWYTAEKGKTWAAYVGGQTVPVSYPKGMNYDSAESLFMKPVS